MNNTFTEEQLLLFIYGDADATLESQIKSALLIDVSLREKHRNMLSLILKLDDCVMEPNPTSLNIIMEQSALSHRQEIY